MTDDNTKLATDLTEDTDAEGAVVGSNPTGFTSPHLDVAAGMN